MSGIYYQLRPNKAIDRMLFFELLMKLNRFCQISEYQYIGFGSYTFEDFKLLHRQLGINDMISIEADDNIYKRQHFNRPFECIKLKKNTSKFFINEEFDRIKPVIFWLDYTDPIKIREQIDEFCGLLGKLESLDIVRLTLNANPSSLGGETIKKEDELHNFRMNKLKERIGDYMPWPSSNTCVLRKEYPKTLLISIRNAFNKYYRPGKKRLLPLSSYVYADGQQMLTFTGIILNSDQEEEEIQKCIQGWNFANNEWGSYYNIAIPSLTPKERITLNERLPGCNISEICSLFDYKFEGVDIRDDIDNYIKYYKYYPNYHQVIF